MKRTIEITSDDYTELVYLRRYFHRNPECGPAEQTETISFISKYLQNIGVEYKYVKKGGIIAFLEGDNHGKTLLLRADTDAVPVFEDEENLCHKKVCVSENEGVMHGCGHDAHMAMLLIVAKVLKQRKPFSFGRVVLLFEEGEEGHNNIKHILSYIMDNNILIDSCFAIHVRWDVDSGKIAFCSDAALVGKIKFKVELSGVAAHSSTPNDGCNTIDCYHKLYEKLYGLRNSLVELDPQITFAITSLSSSGISGFIPSHINLNGVFRTGTTISTFQIAKEIKKICQKISNVYDCTINIEITRFMFPVINDQSCLQLFLSATQEAEIETLECNTWAASESFNCMSMVYPSIMLFLGIANIQEGYGARHHTPQFDINEDVMVSGVKMELLYIDAYFNNPNISFMKNKGKFINIEELLEYYI